MAPGDFARAPVGPLMSHYKIHKDLVKIVSYF
jgi:hypothetical protein